MFNGNSWEAFKLKYLDMTSPAIMPNAEEKWKKLYVSKNYMAKVIKTIVNYSPKLKDFTLDEDTDKRQIKALDACLDNMNWDDLQKEILIDQESKGDKFLHYYFVEGEDAPRIKPLKSKNMTDILFDENLLPKAYIYKDTVTNETVDSKTAVTFTYDREITWVFEKGKYTIIDPMYDTDKKEFAKDKNGKQVYNITVVNAKNEFKDYFQIIHIPSYKNFSDKFSIIPAEDYVDDCLHLDNIWSDWRGINHNAGFPKIMIFDASFDSTISKNSPAGFLFFDSKDTSKSGKTETVQISNSLESIRLEKDEVENSLYETACLVKPKLELKSGSSDSARVVSNFRLPLELKLEKYLTQIAQNMAIYFEIYLKSKNLWKKSYDKVTFELPKVVIKQSIFDDLLAEQQELNIENMKNGNQNTKTPDAVKDIVQSSNNLDNRFKSSL